MEDRIKVLEELCEMLAKQSIEQNNRIMEINRNLINEIKYLRESIEKKDQEMEELTSMLRRLCDLNARPSQMLTNLLPGLFMGGPQGVPPPPPMPHPALASLLQQPQALANLLQSQGLDIQRMPPPPPLINQQSPLNPQQSQPSMFFNPQTPSATNQPPQQPPPVFNQPKPAVQQQQQQAPPKNQGTPQAQQQQANPNLFVFKPTPPPVQPQQQQQQQQPSSTTQTPAQETKPPLFNFSPLKPQFGSTPINEAAAKSSPTAQTTVFGGNAPTITNLFKPPTITSTQSPSSTTTVPKPATQATSSPFSFGAATSGGNLFKAPEPTKLFETKPSSTIAAVADSTTAGGDEGDENEGGGHPEDYEPQIDYKPIVKLTEVEVKTGEEDENVLLKVRCKLFRFDQETKEWKEKGVGDLKILQHKQTMSIRILMRRDQVLKLCANHKISGEMKLTELNPKQFTWMAVDFSEEQSKSELLLGRFKDADDAAKFKVEFEKAVKFAQTTKSPAKAPPSTAAAAPAAAAAKNSLSLLFKSDGWNCNACYAPNKADVLKCACCQTPKPGAPPQSQTTPAASSTTSSVTTTTPAPAAPGPFTFGLQPASSSTAATGTTKPFSFGTTPTSENKITFPKFEFGSALAANKDSPAASTTAAQSSSTPAGGANIATTTIFDKNSLPTFASLAAGSSNPATGKADMPIFGNTNTVSASPIFKPFSNFGAGFGATQANTAVKPLFGTASPAVKADGGEDGEDEGQGNPEEYEPQVEFKPLVKLAEVEVVTGEENEEAVFKQRCKLYRFDAETKEWKEKGTGEMKVLKHKTNENVYRILMRRDQVLKLCANHRITRDLKLEIYNEKQVRWHAQDYSEGSEGKHELLAARFRAEEDAKKFKEEVEKAQEAVDKGSSTTPSTTTAATPAAKPATNEEKNKCEGLKPALSELFKKSNMWTCDGCYVSNKDDVDKCVACATLRKGASSATPAGSSASTNNTNKTPSSIFGSAQSNTSSIQFGSASSNTSKITFGSTNLFQPFNLSSTQTPTKPGDQPPPSAQSTLSTMESIFGAKSGLSFADMAKTASPVGFGGGFKPAATAANPFSTIIKNSQQQQPPMLFGSAQKAGGGGENDEEGGEGNPEDYEPEVEFKPLVKLAEVEVKTGEEEEEALFKTRCKLYRFDTNAKEWKEKGVGDLKILKHLKKENSYRVLMRRDQVLKVCANHRITPELKLESMTEKQLRWVANDCSEGHPSTEILAVKFRQEDDAKRFKELFEEIQSRAGATTPSKPTKNATNQNNDVIEVYSAKPTAELVEKARSYQLPDNFYLYLDKPGCKGCRGCEKCENES